jgi:hypothetical protein
MHTDTVTTYRVSPQLKGPVDCANIACIQGPPGARLLKAKRSMAATAATMITNVELSLYLSVHPSKS